MNNEPRGCLAFLFGFGANTRPKVTGANDASGENEGNVHSGPGGYEDGSYVGGYAAEYRAEQTYFDSGEDYEAGEH